MLSKNKKLKKKKVMMILIKIIIKPIMFCLLLFFKKTHYFFNKYERKKQSSKIYFYKYNINKSYEIYLPNPNLSSPSIYENPLNASCSCSKLGVAIESTAASLVNSASKYSGFNGSLITGMNSG